MTENRVEKATLLLIHASIFFLDCFSYFFVKPNFSPLKLIKKSNQEALRKNLILSITLHATRIKMFLFRSCMGKNRHSNAEHSKILLNDIIKSVQLLCCNCKAEIIHCWSNEHEGRVKSPKNFHTAHNCKGRWDIGSEVKYDSKNHLSAINLSFWTFLKFQKKLS